MNKIVVLGAGYGGVLTAKKLAKKFKKSQDVSITIIDKNPYHTMLTELHEVSAGRVDEESIKMNLSQIFAGKGVQVVLDNIQDIDFKAKKLIGQADQYDYDYLVLGAGSQPTFFGIEGAAENSFTLWSYDDAVILRDHIQMMFRNASKLTNINEKRKMLTFHVVGAGFTGVEMIGELAEYVPVLCKKFEIDPKDVTMVNVDMLPRPVPILPNKLSDKVSRRLEKMGVELMLGVGVVGIGKDFIKVKKDGEEITHVANTVIWAAGIEGSDITTDATKKLGAKGRGRLEVDPYLRSVDDEHVYVIGDNMFFIPEGGELPVPQMVENCEHSASTCAKNLHAQITGGKMEKYNPSFHGIMVSVGGRYAVARGGLSNHQVNLPSFIAMLAKHFINMVYFMQVMGWTKVFSYLKHEFFTIRHRRSILGGHFSNVTPSFMLVPIRIWLGMTWLYEGVHKVVEGWLDSPKLVGFFGGASSWYQSILDPGAVAAAGTDAVSSATAAVEGGAEIAGTVLMNLDIFGLIKFYFVSGKALADSTIADFAFKVDVPLMNTLLERFVLSSDSMMIFMQTFIVVMEILIGLALIGGLFTFMASGVSLVLQLMFVSTTGLYLNTMWMLFAGIATLIASGQTIGLDYYVIPALKKWWVKIPFVRRWYLYND